MNLIPEAVRAAFRAAPRGLAPLVAASSVFLSGCVTETSVTGERERYAYTWEQERQLGAEADREIIAEMGLYPDDDIQEYVSRVGQDVLEQSDLRAPGAPTMYRETPFTFRVLNSTVVNAFALPGGYVYVTRGLLAHVRNEAQLSVVLGHEIGHVAARHSSVQARRAQLGTLGMVAAAIAGQVLLGPEAQDLTGQVLEIAGQGMGLLMLRNGREAEYEADQLGVRYAARTHYATEEGSAFFRTLQRMSEAEGRVLPSWASSHPDPGDRAGRVIQLSNTYRVAGERIVGEEAYLERIEGLVIGDNPREGFVDGGIFYHPDLRLQFPVARGWQLQNETSVVAQLAPDGSAVITYQIAPGSRAREAASQFVRDSSLSVVSTVDRTVNGLPAFVLVGQLTTQQGPTGVWTAFIEMDGRVHQFVGMSAPAALGQHRSTFESVAFGFRPLNDERRLSVLPARMVVLRTDRPGQLSEFLPSNLPAGLTVESLAIMNQVESGETIPAGRLLKIPGSER
jgi:predicted Zn-dependent protease